MLRQGINTMDNVLSIMLDHSRFKKLYWIIFRVGLKWILQFIRLQLCRKGQQLGSYPTPTNSILVSSTEYLFVIGVSIQNLNKRIHI